MMPQWVENEFFQNYCDGPRRCEGLVNVIWRGRIQSRISIVILCKYDVCLRVKEAPSK